jgi:branched-chain amino acid transport system ATP-binding protein
MSLLEIENLRARYGDSIAVHDVSFAVETGDLFGILGANGAGKTTILRAIGGLHPPIASGAIRFEGADLMSQPAHKRAELGIGVVPEGRRMFSSMSIRDSLLLGAYRRGKVWQQRNLERVLETFPELRDRMGQATGSLSGGQQQMVAFGRALMCEPRLLLLDEPSLGLAPVVVQRIFDLLKELHASTGLTMVLVEQNAVEAFPLLTRGTVIERGRVAFTGTREELESSDVIGQAYFGAPGT